MKMDGDYYSGFETLKECEIKLLTDQTRKDTFRFYGDKLKALEEWARDLDQTTSLLGKDVTHAVFNCLANGHADTLENVNYAAQLNSVKHQLQAAREKIMELETAP